MPASRSRLVAPAIFATAFLALGSIIGLAAPASAASPVTIGSVGYDTIGDALAAASAGDTVTVAAGTYVESLDVTVPVTLVGAGASSTTIVAAGGSAALTLDARTKVSGFTIEGQPGVPTTSSPFAPSALSIDAGGAGSTIHGNVLANGYHGVYASGVVGSSSRVTVIENNTIRGFHADQGTGVWIANSTYFEVIGNSISDTAPIDGNAVGINLVCGSSHIQIGSNTITDVGNAVVDIANGSCNASGNVTIQNNAVANTSGSALYFGANNLSAIAVTGNSIQHVGGSSGAVVISGDSDWLATSGVPITGFVVSGNTVSDAPNGIYVGDGVVLGGNSSVTSSHNKLCSSGLAIENETTDGFTVTSISDNFCSTGTSGVKVSKQSPGGKTSGESGPTLSTAKAAAPSSEAGADGPLAFTGDSSTGSGSNSTDKSPAQTAPAKKISERELREEAGFPLWLGIVIGVLVLAMVFFLVFFVVRRRDA